MDQTLVLVLSGISVSSALSSSTSELILTSVFAHDGRLDVVRCAAPHADRLRVAGVHSASLLIETEVPATKRWIHS